MNSQVERWHDKVNSFYTSTIMDLLFALVSAFGLVYAYVLNDKGLVLIFGVVVGITIGALTNRGRRV